MALFFRAVLAFCVIFVNINDGLADHAVFFDEPFYQGSTFTLSENGGCYNFKRKWVDRISSVQVQPESCMIAWDQENCLGQSVKLMSNTKETEDLRTVMFDKKMKSISLCTEISFRPILEDKKVEIGDRMWNPDDQYYRMEQPKKVESTTGAHETHLGVKRQRVELSFYDRPNFRGSIFTLTSNGDCYNFKAKWMNRISSIDTSGHCIFLWDRPGCDGSKIRLTSEDINAFQNLQHIRFDKKVQSIQLCERPVIMVDEDESGEGSSSMKQDQFQDNLRSNVNAPPSQPSDMSKDDDVRETALQEHNKLRKLHRVPDLEWDFKLQHIAQKHADWLARNNKFEHSSNDELGENIGGISTGSKVEALRDSIHLWYNEIKNYDFERPNVSVLGIKAGHFTQLVWKTTTHIGLGVAWNPKRNWYVVVCNYSPPGNYKGDYENNVLPPIPMEE